MSIQLPGTSFRSVIQQCATYVRLYLVFDTVSLCGIRLENFNTSEHC